MSRLITELPGKLLTMPMAGLAIFAASVGSLATALIAEKFFDVAPCILCIYQRFPYAISAALAILALCPAASKGRIRLCLALAAATFFVNAGIAFFHSGVELQWWAGTDECGVNPMVMKDVTEMRDMLLKTPTVRCDQINFTFLGFTMANWNVLASLGLGLFAALAAALVKKGNDEGCGCCGSGKSCG